MFNITQFRSAVVVPSLSDLQLYSKDAEELLVFTCAVESNGGTYLHQVNGPAVGIYQIEPNTYTHIWINHIAKHTPLQMMLALKFNIPKMVPVEVMATDLRFATAMARLFYARFKDPLPKHDDIDGIWDYYKRYYNTSLGKAVKGKSIEAYKAFLKNT